MSGNFAIKGGGVGPLMANAILNFHFDYLTPSLSLQNSPTRVLVTFEIVDFSRFLGDSGDCCDRRLALA